MAIQTLLVINKSGGLIYHRNYTSENNGLNSNDYLILASTLHSVFAIANQLTPKAVQLNSGNKNSISNNTSNNNDPSNEKTPYIPYVGINPNDAPGTKTGTNKLGSFLGDDYFNEPFVSWNKSGLKQLSTDQFTMFIYQTMTGMKFVAISSSVLRNLPEPSSTSTTTTNPTTNPTTQQSHNTPGYTSNSSNLQVQIADNFLRKVYCIYCDYVMKDPFYSLEMPIKSELFDKKVRLMVSNFD